MKKVPILLFALLCCLVALTNMSKYETSHNPEKYGGESFAEFLSQFKKIDLPFGMDIHDYQQYHNLMLKQQYVRNRKKAVHKEPMVNTIKRTRFIPEISRGHFGRMGPPTVIPVARFYPDENTVAIIYNSRPRYAGAFIGDYQMIRYDLKGRIKPFQQGGAKMDHLYLGSSHRSRSTTFRIDESGNIHQLIFEIKQNIKNQKDPQSVTVDFGTPKLLESNIIRISDEGKVKITPEKIIKERV